VVIAQRWDAQLADRVASGTPAVVFACRDDALPAGFPLAVRARAETRWVGVWAQGMGWLRPMLSEGLAIGPRVDLAFTGITARHVLHGLGPERRDDMLAGLYVGWLRDTVGTIVVVRHGAGAAVVCTYRLLEQAESDGLACMLVDRLAEEARSLVS
jgi:hypothetical protein